MKYLFWWKGRIFLWLYLAFVLLYGGAFFLLAFYLCQYQIYGEVSADRPFSIYLLSFLLSLPVTISSIVLLGRLIRPPNSKKKTKEVLEDPSLKPPPAEKLTLVESSQPEDVPTLAVQTQKPETLKEFFEQRRLETQDLKVDLERLNAMFGGKKAERKNPDADHEKLKKLFN